MVNLSQGFKDMLTLLREAGHGVYKIVSGVNQAVGQHNAEALRHISGESVTHLDVLITNPKKVEVGMDLLDFPSIVFYQIPMSTYTLRQASRRSWRIPQRKPVRVYFLTYSETMQTRLMQLMADKLMSSLAVEGELSDKGLAALSETSDSMAKELAKMLIEKSESDESQSLKDIWAAYRKKEIQVELTIREDLPQAATEPVIICTEKADAPAPEIKMASTDVEKIGDRVVKVQFIEYTGKRKKKVTHIEVSA